MLVKLSQSLEQTLENERTTRVPPIGANGMSLMSFAAKFVRAAAETVEFIRVKGELTTSVVVAVVEEMTE